MTALKPGLGRSKNAGNRSARMHAGSTGSRRPATTRDSRAPQQERSRRSFGRVIDAASAILAEGGLAMLTLTEVSRRSGVSIGSIYSRIQGKDALIRAVQAKALVAMQDDFNNMVGEIRRQDLQLRELVPSVVRSLALFLRRHARLLSAFMQVAMSDPRVAAAGRKAHFQDLNDLRRLLLEKRHEIRHADPEHAVETCFMVTYGALARYLGLAPSSDSTGEGNWDQLLVDLGLMSLAFLLMDLAHSAASGDVTLR